MKVDYKGFEISVERERSLGGWDSTYYHVMEKETGYFLVDSFSDSEDTVREWINDLKKVVDSYANTPKTCGNCSQLIGEECGITGEEVNLEDVRDCCEIEV